MTAYKYISQLANNQRRIIDRMAINKDYSGAQARVMHFLTKYKEGDVYQKDIERIFGLRPSTATELLKGMEKRGLIQRIPSAHDSRFKKLILTEKVDKYKEDLLSDMEDLESIIVDGVSDEEFETWLKVSEKMLNNLERKQNEK